MAAALQELGRIGDRIAREPLNLYRPNISILSANLNEAEILALSAERDKRILAGNGDLLSEGLPVAGAKFMDVGAMTSAEETEKVAKKMKGVYTGHDALMDEKRFYVFEEVVEAIEPALRNKEFPVLVDMGGGSARGLTIAAQILERRLPSDTKLNVKIADRNIRALFEGFENLQKLGLRPIEADEGGQNVQMYPSVLVGNGILGRVEFLHCDVTKDIGIKPHSADAAMMTNLAHHLTADNIQDALNQTHKILKLKGASASVVDAAPLTAIPDKPFAKLTMKERLELARRIATEAIIRKTVNLDKVLRKLAKQGIIITDDEIRDGIEIFASHDTPTVFANAPSAELLLYEARQTPLGADVVEAGYFYPQHNIVYNQFFPAMNRLRIKR